MRITWNGPGVLGFSAALGFFGCAAMRNLPQESVEHLIGRWSPPSAAAATVLVAEYGIPDDVTLNTLTWNRRGVWKRTVVRNRRQVYRAPEDLAVLEQTVDYRATTAQAAEMLAFSSAVTVDVERGELSSRAGRESEDYLNLNLAHEVARGLKTAPEAVAYREYALELAAAGKTSPYTSGLLFDGGN
jgi:hypothetical protein